MKHICELHLACGLLVATSCQKNSKSNSITAYILKLMLAWGGG